LRQEKTNILAASINKYSCGKKKQIFLLQEKTNILAARKNKYSCGKYKQIFLRQEKTNILAARKNKYSCGKKKSFITMTRKHFFGIEYNFYGSYKFDFASF